MGNTLEKVIRFKEGNSYRIVDYRTLKDYLLVVKKRKKNWLIVDIGGIEREVRVYPVTNPTSESILLNDYSPVFSYLELNR